MPKLYESTLGRRKLATRRGVWTTWGAPCTWSSWLVRSDGADIIPELRACDCVTKVEDVSHDVFAGTFRAPENAWSLLVCTPYQDWATFVDSRRYNESLEPLRQQFAGEVLTTGMIDDISAFYVRLWVNGSKAIELVTDGMGWPMPPEDIDEDDDEDYREIFEFYSDRHEATWPHSFERCEEAHQQLIIDLDAYVAGLALDDSQITSIHQDAADRKNIESVHLVLLDA